MEYANVSQIYFNIKEIVILVQLTLQLLPIKLDVFVTTDIHFPQHILVKPFPQ